MSSTITRGSIPRLLQEGAKNVFGNNYKMLDPIHAKLYEVIGSKKAYELAVQLEGFGPAAQKDEADDITFDTRAQGYAPKYVHVTWGKGFVMSREAIRDELYGQLTSGAKALGRSMAITKEINAASLFNTAFATTSAMPGGDGLAMISTAHLNGPSGGTYSNRLAIDADFSEASLEDMLKIIGRATDPRGLPMALRANMLVGHSDQMFEFQRVLKSDGQNDTANNAINAVKSLNSVKGIIATPYLSADVDAWFLTTDCPDGLKMYQREDVTFDQDLTFASRNSRFLAFESYVFGYDDPHCVYASAGA
jgi:hypothetical protein